LDGEPGALHAAAPREPRAIVTPEDEANLPAEEAQASPFARVSRAHAFARWADDDQAQTGEGSKAPVGLTVTDAA
jgi:hypothetical protein